MLHRPLLRHYISYVSFSGLFASPRGPETAHWRLELAAFEVQVLRFCGLGVLVSKAERFREVFLLAHGVEKDEAMLCRRCSRPSPTQLKSAQGCKNRCPSSEVLEYASGSISEPTKLHVDTDIVSRLARRPASP